jgi:hypothetical protein
MEDSPYSTYGFLRDKETCRAYNSQKSRPKRNKIRGTTSTYSSYTKNQKICTSYRKDWNPVRVCSAWTYINTFWSHIRYLASPSLSLSSPHPHLDALCLALYHTPSVIIFLSFFPPFISTTPLSPPRHFSATKIHQINIDTEKNQITSS